MEFLADLPGWVSIITLQVAGLIAIYGIFDSKYRERQKEQNAQEDRIISLYKTEVSALKEKLTTYDNDLKTMRNELSRLSGENTLLRDLLTGKDKDTAEWRGRTEDAMQLVAEIGKLAVANGKKTDAAIKLQNETNKNIMTLAKSIDKHLTAK